MNIFDLCSISLFLTLNNIRNSENVDDNDDLSVMWDDIDELLELPDIKRDFVPPSKIRLDPGVYPTPVSRLRTLIQESCPIPPQQQQQQQQPQLGKRKREFYLLTPTAHNESDHVKYTQEQMEKMFLEGNLFWNDQCDFPLTEYYAEWRDLCVTIWSKEESEYRKLECIPDAQLKPSTYLTVHFKKLEEKEVTADVLTCDCFYHSKGRTNNRKFHVHKHKNRSFFILLSRKKGVYLYINDYRTITIT